MAMLRMPGTSCLSVKFSSAKLGPYMLSPVCAQYVGTQAAAKHQGERTQLLAARCCMQFKKNGRHASNHQQARCAHAFCPYVCLLLLLCPQVHSVLAADWTTIRVCRHITHAQLSSVTTTLLLPCDVPSRAVCCCCCCTTLPTSCAVAFCGITALTHKLRDHSVNRRAFEVQGLAGSAHAPLARAQAPKVFRSLGRDICPQLHHYASRIFFSYAYVEEDSRIVPHSRRLLVCAGSEQVQASTEMHDTANGFNPVTNGTECTCVAPKQSSAT